MYFTDLEMGGITQTINCLFQKKSSILRYSKTSFDNGNTVMLFRTIPIKTHNFLKVSTNTSESLGNY